MRDLLLGPQVPSYRTSLDVPHLTYCIGGMIYWVKHMIVVHRAGAEAEAEAVAEAEADSLTIPTRDHLRRLRLQPPPPPSPPPCRVCSLHSHPGRRRLQD